MIVVDRDAARSGTMGASAGMQYVREGNQPGDAVEEEYDRVASDIGAFGTKKN